MSNPYKYVILDRDSKFNGELTMLLKSSGLKAVPTSVKAPQQNGIAERWVETARRDFFDHVIALSEEHIRRLGRELVSYYLTDRTHLGRVKDTPNGRAVERRPVGAKLESLP